MMIMTQLYSQLYKQPQMCVRNKKAINTLYIAEYDNTNQHPRSVLIRHIVIIRNNYIILTYAWTGPIIWPPKLKVNIC